MFRNKSKLILGSLLLFSSIVLAQNTFNAPVIMKSTLNVVGNSTLANLKVTGGSTTAALQVTGHTSTATLGASGLATVGSATVTGATNSGSLVVSGHSSLATLSTTGLSTLNSATVTNNINAANIIVSGNATTATLGTTGLATLNSANITNAGSLGSLTVSGHSSLATMATTGLATLNSATVTNALNGSSLNLTGNATTATLSTSGLASLNSLNITNNATTASLVATSNSSTFDLVVSRNSSIGFGKYLNTFTPPRKTATELTALAPEAGAIAYDTTNNVLKYYTGSSWTNLDTTGGGSSLTPTAKSTTYTAASGDFVIGNAATTTFSVTLPTATSGARVVIKKNDTTFNLISIVGTVNGVSGNSVNTFGETLDLMADGSSWHILSRIFNTEWTSWTPTSTWTSNTTTTSKWKRIGDDIWVEVRMALSGAPNAATNPVITFPTNSVTIDTGKMVLANGQNTSHGKCDYGDTGSAGYGGMVAYASTTSVELQVWKADGTYINGQGVTSTVPTTFANTDNVVCVFHYPITGWH